MTMPNTTILIAEDDIVSREVLEDLLAHRGYHILTAANGVEACAQAEQHRPDIILLDVMMPLMNGFEVCQRLRAHPDLAAIPIVMITALDDRDSRLEALRIGVDDIISKPFNSVELQLRVQTIVRLNRYRRLWEERQRREQAEQALRLRERELATLEDLLLRTAVATIDELDQLLVAAARLLSTVMNLPNVAIELHRSLQDFQPLRVAVSEPHEPAFRSPIHTAQGAHGEIIFNTYADCPPEIHSQKLIGSVANMLGHAVERAMLSAQTQVMVRELEELVAIRTSEVRSERDRTQAILEAIGEAVVVVNAEGAIQYANPAAAQLYESSVDGLRGLSWEQVLPINTLELHEQLPYLRPNEALRYDTITSYRQDGSSYDTAITIAPLFTHADDLHASGYVSVQRDVSAIRAAERMKDQFIANVSHELRTPLSVIALHSGNLDTLYQILDHDRKRHLIREIRSQTRLLSELLSGVLDLVRTGHIEHAQRRTLDLRKIILDTINQQSSLAQFKHIQIVERLPNPVFISGDERLLRQLVGNLLGNAIKYTEEGGTIEVGFCIKEESPADHLDSGGALPSITLYVQDSGIGIAAEHVPHIFERFYRAEPESTTPGIGLGLAIAATIARDHGGTITVESQLGKGSIFRVNLPTVSTRE